MGRCIETVKLIIMSGGDALLFRSTNRAINAMKSHDTLRLELHLSGSGRVTFTYSLVGARKAIEEARANRLAQKSEVQ